MGVVGGWGLLPAGVVAHATPGQVTYGYQGSHHPM